MSKAFPERKFFDTFGYLEIENNDHRDIHEAFERQYEKAQGLPVLADTKNVYSGPDGRRHGLRYNDFDDDRVLSVFYNNTLLNQLRALFDDFVVLSALESFYLGSTGVHRDYASEIKHVKIMFYLDDVSDPTKGPLYMIPGSQNMYDKYSTSIGSNVGWPAPELGGGGDFLRFQRYMNKNMPKKYFTSNCDKIIIFNTNAFHGSDGNYNEPKKLRRALGMVITLVDRNNPALMSKVHNLYAAFDIRPKETTPYAYCEKAGLTEWLEHFDIGDENLDFDPKDSGDANALLASHAQLAGEMYRWKYYVDEVNKRREESRGDSIYNCFTDQLKFVNDLENKNVRGL